MTEADELRTRLLGAARDELAEAGLGRVSLRAVARRAGLSHASPAYAFGDRSGLLTAVVAAAFRELAAELDEPIGHGEDEVAVLGRRYLRFASRNPALYDLMFRPEELRSNDENLAAARQASLRRLVQATTGGEVRPNEATVLSWAVAHGIASLARQGALDVITREASADHLINTYACLLSRSRTTEQPPVR